MIFSDRITPQQKAQCNSNAAYQNNAFQANKRQPLVPSSFKQEAALLRQSKVDAAVYSLVFSPDNTRLAAMCADHTVGLFDPVNGEKIEYLRHQGIVERVDFASSPSAKYFITQVAKPLSEETQVHLWELETGSEKVFAHSTNAALYLGKISSDGAYVAVAHASHTNRHKISIWDTRTGGQNTALIWPQGPIELMEFSPVTNTLMTTVGYMSQFWKEEEESTESRINLYVGQITALTFSPNSTQLAVSFYNIETQLSTVCQWANNQCTTFWNGTALQPFHRLAYNQESTLLAGAKDNSISLWNSKAGSPFGKSIAAAGYTDQMFFSADGRYLATGGSQKGEKMQVWHVPCSSLTCEETIDCQPAMAFSPDSTLWFALRSEKIMAYDLPQRKLAYTICLEPKCIATSFALATDGCIAFAYTKQENPEDVGEEARELHFINLYQGGSKTTAPKDILETKRSLCAIA